MVIAFLRTLLYERWTRSIKLMEKENKNDRFSRGIFCFPLDCHSRLFFVITGNKKLPLPFWL